MALLDWFQEIHLRLSMHYCPVVRSRPQASEENQPILSNIGLILPRLFQFTNSV